MTFESDFYLTTLKQRSLIIYISSNSAEVSMYIIFLPDFIVD